MFYRSALPPSGGRGRLLRFSVISDLDPPTGGERTYKNPTEDASPAPGGGRARNWVGFGPREGAKSAGVPRPWRDGLAPLPLRGGPIPTPREGRQFRLPPKGERTYPPEGGERRPPHGPVRGAPKGIVASTRKHRRSREKFLYIGIFSRYRIFLDKRRKVESSPSPLRGGGSDDPSG